MQTAARPSLLLVISAALIVAAAAWIPRGLALDRFVTQDEPLWLARSANFYQALSQRQFQNTFQREHPGVTVTWAGTAGFILRYLDYVRVGPGQMQRPAHLEAFLAQHGVRPLDILQAGRAIMVLAIVAALGTAFLYAVRLLGLLPALLGFLLVAFDPFFTGLSRLLHLDGLVSALMLLSLLAFGSYLYAGRRRSDLLISAIAAGLSWLTKSPAFFLIPFAGLLLLIEVARERHSERVMTTARRQFWPFLAWLGAAAAVFCLLWPAMWVNPLGSLRGVFSMASSYSAGGHAGGIFFNGRLYTGSDSAWYFYPVAYLWRATPVVHIGLGLAALSLLWRRKTPFSPTQARFAGAALLFGLLFTVFISLGAKKFDRYLLPVFAPLDLLAALGWLGALGWLQAALARHSARLRNALAAVFLVVVVSMQLLGAVKTFPYYFNYFNPMFGGPLKGEQVLMAGWGEGLEQAAAYLNGLPGARGLKVIAWCGEGCFSYFFKGYTIEMDWDIPLSEFAKADYAVLYISQLQRGLPGPQVLAYFQDKTPAHTVTIQQQTYALIYKLR